MTLLFHSPDASTLAARMLEESRGGLVPGVVRWKRFPDGFPDFFIEDVDAARHRHVAFLLSLPTPASVFEQLAVLMSLSQYPLASLTILLPFFPVGTMERVEYEGQVSQD